MFSPRSPEHRPGRARAVLGIGLALLGGAAIALVTLTPMPLSNQPHPAPLLTPPGPADFLRNVLLFIPFGFGLRLAGVSWGRAFVALLMATVSIEALQMHVVAGRDASIWDVAGNAVGGAIGIAAAARWRRWILPTASGRRALGAVAVVAWLGTLAGSAKGLEVSLPMGAYRVRWAPTGEGADWFRGRLLAASIAETPVHQDGEQPAAARAGSAWLERGGVRVQAALTPGRPLIEESTIVGLIDDRTDDVIALAQNGTDLVFRVRTRFVDLGLHAPALGLSGAFRAGDATAAARDTLRAAAERDVRHIVVSLDAPAGARQARLPISVGLGWTAISPVRHFDPLGFGTMTALWLFALSLPLGYWLGGNPNQAAGRRGLMRVALLGALLVVGLAAVPSLSGLSPSPWWEWVGATAGMFAGRAMNRMSRVMTP